MIKIFGLVLLSEREYLQLKEDSLNYGKWWVPMVMLVELVKNRRVTRKALIEFTNKSFYAPESEIVQVEKGYFEGIVK